MPIGFLTDVDRDRLNRFRDRMGHRGNLLEPRGPAPYDDKLWWRTAFNNVRRSLRQQGVCFLPDAPHNVSGRFGASHRGGLSRPCLQPVLVVRSLCVFPQRLGQAALDGVGRGAPRPAAART